MTKREQLWGAFVSVTMLAAITSPLLDDEDGFPLSTFPMFSRARPDELSLDHVVLVAADGTTTPVPPGLVFSSEVLQTKVAIHRAVRGGRRAAERLCQRVAARLREEGHPGAFVEIRTDRYRVLTYVDGDETPLVSRRHARCPVDGAEEAR